MLTSLQARNLQGKVNASEFLGRPAGHLVVAFVSGWKEGKDNLKDVVITLIEDTVAPWNSVPDKDGIRRPVREDLKGIPLYLSAEFPPESDTLKYEIRKR